MRERHAVVQIEPGSELDHVLETEPDAEVVLERAGIRYRLERVVVSASHRDALPPRVPVDPERVLAIIGLGESTESSNIAERKHEYLADAADHRES